MARATDKVVSAGQVTSSRRRRAWSRSLSYLALRRVAAMSLLPCWRMIPSWALRRVARLAGRLAALPRERATLSDWANHLSTIFPEVRLKRYLEMRGADVGPPERICALAALMAGLYYDSDALAGAGDLIKGWSAEARQKLRDEAPRLALEARIGGRSLGVRVARRRQRRVLRLRWRSARRRSLPSR